MAGKGKSKALNFYTASMSGHDGAHTMMAITTMEPECSYASASCFEISLPWVY